MKMKEHPKSQRTPIKVKGSHPSPIRAARRLLELISQEEDIERCDLIHPFVMCACSAIENTLSDVYIDFMYQKMGKAYKGYVKPLLKLPITTKFPLIVPIVSDYKYVLNQKSDKCQYLYKLFSLRNRFAHIEEHWNTATYIENDNYQNIVFDHPKHEKHYYSNDWPVLDYKTLKEILEFMEEAHGRIRNLHGKVKHWKWKPEPWFIPLKKKKM